MSRKNSSKYPDAPKPRDFPADNERGYDVAEYKRAYTNWYYHNVYKHSRSYGKVKERNAARRKEVETRPFNKPGGYRPMNGRYGARLDTEELSVLKDNTAKKEAEIAERVEYFDEHPEHADVGIDDPCDCILDAADERLHRKFPYSY